jgi:mono/diheme cytochrome c family protein
MTSSLGRTTCSGLILLFFALLIFAPAHHGVHAANINARQRGAIVFQSKGCERCHSILGVGGDRAPDLSEVGTRKSSAQIKQQIINGGHGMPPFGNVLSKDEVKDVTTFLASCQSAVAPGCRQWMQPETEQQPPQ